MTIQIIKHAFSMIFNNLGQALRVSIGPFVILLLVVIAAGQILGASIDTVTLTTGTGDAPLIGLSGLLALAALLIAVVFVLAWVAVSWHRFILLEEYSGALPMIAQRPILPYVWRTLIYGSIMGLVSIPVVFIAGLFAAPFLPTDLGRSGGTPTFPLLIFFIAGAFISYLWLRMALALPSVAVGKPIGLGDAWQASSRMAGTIFGVAVVLIAINAVAGLAVEQVYAFLPLVALVLDLAVQWVTVMLGISILTTLYGHLIEKRPLID